LRSFTEFLAKKEKSKARKARRQKKANEPWRPDKIKAADRKNLIARLDSAFSILIRIRTKREIGHCAFCPKPIEHCFHFITRAKYSIRWDSRNAIGSCRGCNYRNEFDPHNFVYYFIRRWGQQSLNDLIRDGNRVAKFSNDDLRAMLVEMQNGRMSP